MTNSKFVRVKVFSWDTFFAGAKAIRVRDSVTIEDLKAYKFIANQFL